MKRAQMKKPDQRILAMPGDPDLLNATAYHEAGHSVMAYRFRMWGPQLDVMINPVRPGEGFAGCRQQVWPCQASGMRLRGGIAWRDWQHRAEQCIITTLAGPLAEVRYVRGRFPRGILRGEGPDFYQVHDMIRVLISYEPDTQGWRLYEQILQMDACRALRERRTWGALEALADLLLSHGTVPGEVIEEVFQQWKVPRVRDLACIRKAS